VLRISVSDGQDVAKDDELLVLDVMKMETPITAPRSGRVTIRVAVMDKVSTGDTLALIG
ncbi:MAG: acetyl-CoA carboxylase biotin carboxyl carrier protein subunit, partial [Proteobacteria bacterium]|nr:acetyl-CoA carboxylase biotin carboxyl carrier protein subunit [Pseudomonadota bacterium]